MWRNYFYLFSLSVRINIHVFAYTTISIYKFIYIYIYVEKEICVLFSWNYFFSYFPSLLCCSSSWMLFCLEIFLHYNFSRVIISNQTFTYAYVEIGIRRIPLSTTCSLFSQAKHITTFLPLFITDESRQ